MKQLFFVYAIFLSLISCLGTKIMATGETLTSKYAGQYSFGSDLENGSMGSISIYPETDSTILFYIELNQGAPSYNSGTLYGRVAIRNGQGIFYTESQDSDDGCKWNFYFAANDLNISTIDDQYACGFGHAVFVDGIYKKQATKAIDYFKDMEGTKIYFEKTKPEDYYRD
jgi:hypothetical protein